jgi:hypothetical protein
MLGSDVRTKQSKQTGNILALEQPSAVYCVDVFHIRDRHAKKRSD